jgi:non-ribosomal peptide synthetase component F
MIGHYVTLLGSIVASANEHAGRLGMLTGVEEQLLLKDFNATEISYPDKSLIDLFEEQVLKNPEAVAVVYENDRLTYRELNERSNQVAHLLVKMGVKADTLVPICIERSLEMIIGIVGIIKAGAAYVPVDPEYPADRISYMLHDTEATVVLTSRESREKLNGTTSASIIELDGDEEMIAREAVTNTGVKLSPTGLAYVIYTSGSTGRPKDRQAEGRNDAGR